MTEKRKPVEPDTNIFYLTGFINIGDNENYMELEYNPAEEMVMILKNSDDTGIWIKPSNLRQLAKDIELFATKLDRLLEN